MRRTSRSASPRSLQRVKEAEELALTEDPDQQRARHRLIGAAVLVLISVVALPRILDSQPKTLNNDIAISIVTSLPQTPETNSAVAPKVEEKSVSTPAITSAPKENVSPPSEVQTAKKMEPKVEAKKEAVQSAPIKDKTPAMGLAAGEEVVITSSEPKTNESAVKPSAVGNGGKFIIQIGAFASQERANGWITKMKEEKIPNYVLNKTNSSGVKLYVLRAGPFTEKDLAEVAEVKLKAMGLTPRIVEVGAP